MVLYIYYTKGVSSPNSILRSIHFLIHKYTKYETKSNPHENINIMTGNSSQKKVSQMWDAKVSDAHCAILDLLGHIDKDAL